MDAHKTSTPLGTNRDRATALAEQLRNYIDHCGLYGTSPEPEKYPDRFYPPRNLDGRLTVVKILATALREQRAQGLREAAHACRDGVLVNDSTEAKAFDWRTTNPQCIATWLDHRARELESTEGP